MLLQINEEVVVYQHDLNKWKNYCLLISNILYSKMQNFLSDIKCNQECSPMYISLPSKPILQTLLGTSKNDMYDYIVIS